MHDTTCDDAQSFWFGLRPVFSVDHSFIEHALAWFGFDGRRVRFRYDAEELAVLILDQIAKFTQ